MKFDLCTFTNISILTFNDSIGIIACLHSFLPYRMYGIYCATT